MSIGPVRDPGLLRPGVAASSPLAGAGSQIADGPSPFARLLAGLGREVQEGESLVRSAIGAAHAGSLGPADLIALQAGVYRYSEAVDLASRLVDRATASVKAVLQAQ